MLRASATTFHPGTDRRYAFGGQGTSHQPPAISQQQRRTRRTALSPHACTFTRANTAGIASDDCKSILYDRYGRSCTTGTVLWPHLLDELPAAGDGGQLLLAGHLRPPRVAGRSHVPTVRLVVCGRVGVWACWHERVGVSVWACGRGSAGVSVQGYRYAVAWWGSTWCCCVARPQAPSRARAQGLKANLNAPGEHDAIAAALYEDTVSR